MDYKKPQSTIVQGDVGIYPLTTADQVILADGSRLEKDGKISADSASDSSKLGGKAPEYYVQQIHRLDNSDFTNPVNQRGITSADVSAWTYFIDRWKVEDDTLTISVETDGIHLTASSRAWFAQWIQMSDNDVGKTFTLAYGLSDGSIIMASGTMPDASEWSEFITGANDAAQIRSACFENRKITVGINPKSNLVIKWAALYEGSYTAETLPPYVPKGYAQELAECQRYYYKMKSHWKWVSAGICETSTKAFIPIVLPREMRIVPTVSITNPSLIKVKCGSIGTQIPSNINWSYGILDARIMQMAATVTGATNGDVAFLYFDDGGEITFSADL